MPDSLGKRSADRRILVLLETGKSRSDPRPRGFSAPPAEVVATGGENWSSRARL